jgi:hypothetical protein
MPELKNAETRRMELKEEKLRQKEIEKDKEKEEFDNFCKSVYEKYMDNIIEAEDIIDERIRLVYNNVVQNDNNRKHKMILLTNKECKKLFDKTKDDEFSVIQIKIYEYLCNCSLIKELKNNKYNTYCGWRFWFPKGK